ncbi:MAG: hypothetical protein IKC33_00215, partial [Clostridia bacterium]|nr:hypothetical protein [Clostridia bacterium]
LLKQYDYFGLNKNQPLFVPSPYVKNKKKSVFKGQFLKFIKTLYQKTEGQRVLYLFVLFLYPN